MLLKLEKEKATHSSILTQRIPWTEVPGGLQSLGSQRVRYKWVTNTFTFKLFKRHKPTIVHLPLAKTISGIQKASCPRVNDYSPIYLFIYRWNLLVWKRIIRSIKLNISIMTQNLQFSCLFPFINSHINNSDSHFPDEEIEVQKDDMTSLRWHWS